MPSRPGPYLTLFQRSLPYGNSSCDSVQSGSAIARRGDLQRTLGTRGCCLRDEDEDRMRSAWVKAFRRCRTWGG